MPVTVRDVLRMECLSQARVVAGERGLDREVYWITVGEEPDLPEWVFGGELILSTLFAVEPHRRDEYVKGLSDRGVAGLMFKPERFLGAIPQSVLETADRESFPVAEVPIDVLWSRVLAGFYRPLLAEQTGLVRVETEMRLRGGFLDELLSGQISGEEILRRAVAKHILRRCRERLKSLPVHAGLGEPRESPDQIIRSYREADSALCVGQRLRTAKDVDGRIHSFAALGVQKMLFALSQDSPETLRGFQESTVGPVVDYDREQGTQLLKTLSTYMGCNGNIPEVAALLNVHKHTVRYRLRRVTELTGLDVTRFEDAAQLYLAVKATELR